KVGCFIMPGKLVKKSTHPLFVLTHWINCLAMLFLALSGLYIAFPVFGYFMGTARGIHFFWMFVLIINITIRIVSMFFIKTCCEQAGEGYDYDYKNWFPQKTNRHQMWPMIKYYLFFKKDYPITAKYAGLQKLAYWLSIILTFAAAYTGFAIWGPTMDLGIFRFGNQLLGGLFGFGGGDGLMAMRIVHNWVMWFIIIFTCIHGYLANIYGTAASKLIFLYKDK
ncbi:MAG: cytochrome b/b6 domain-containing protein, partial [Coriobacteriia bacterium]|nr:cytochrome b/b6 domain-containing protein [Coriobacteriia bacterium]